MVMLNVCLKGITKKKEKQPHKICHDHNLRINTLGCGQFEKSFFFSVIILVLCENVRSTDRYLKLDLVHVVC